MVAEPDTVRALRRRLSRQGHLTGLQTHWERLLMEQSWFLC